MQSVRVLEGQSLFDIAVQVYGFAESVAALAADNNLGVTDSLSPGTVLSVRDYLEGENTTLRLYLSRKNIQISSGAVVTAGGIGSMAVGIDNTVG